MTDDNEDPLKFAPGVLEKLAGMSPEAQEAIREALANMRQAQRAVNRGEYASFDDAMEAITGQRPEAVE